MSSELGAWLRRQREDRGWTRSEMARQLIKAAKAKGDTSVPSADNISHNIYRLASSEVCLVSRGRARLTARCATTDRGWPADAQPWMPALPNTAVMVACMTANGRCEMAVPED